MQVEDAIEMFKKVGVVQGSDGKPASAPLKVEEFIACIERFYSPEQKLESKLHSEELFEAFLSSNPTLVPSKHSQSEEENEELKQKVEEEVKAAREKWRKQVICEHLVSLRGVELIYFEFRELLVDLAANKVPRDQVDPKRTGKVKVFLTKFLDELLLKRLGAFIRHAGNQGSSKAPVTTAAARKWPESEKDRLIRVKVEERRRIEEEAR